VNNGGRVKDGVNNSCSTSGNNDGMDTGTGTTSSSTSNNQHQHQHQQQSSNKKIKKIYSTMQLLI
jgi:hypothetical protein